jgi:hypothetical protein
MSDKNFKVKNGIDANGTITASEFSGSGASLTDIPNTALDNSSITINGSAVSLGDSVSITGLPSQTGNSGKYLKTDGTDASWATVEGGGGGGSLTGYDLVKSVENITGMSIL